MHTFRAKIHCRWNVSGLARGIQVDHWGTSAWLGTFGPGCLSQMTKPIYKIGGPGASHFANQVRTLCCLHMAVNSQKACLNRSSGLSPRQTMSVCTISHSASVAAYPEHRPGIRNTPLNPNSDQLHWLKLQASQSSQPRAANPHGEWRCASQEAASTLVLHTLSRWKYQCPTWFFCAAQQDHMWCKHLGLCSLHDMWSTQISKSPTMSFCRPSGCISRRLYAHTKLPCMAQQWPQISLQNVGRRDGWKGRNPGNGQGWAPENSRPTSYLK